MIDLIEILIRKDHAYKAENGDVYFSVANYPEYGRLSRKKMDEQEGARIEIGELKRDPRDFALWKSSPDESVGWDSPWGYGRPGWHLECSAMSMDTLGECFDIHGGGSDLLFHIMKMKLLSHAVPPGKIRQVLDAQWPTSSRQ